MVLNIALDENDSQLNKITIALEMAESIGLFFFACKIYPMNAESLEKLVLMKMPFGKHAGRALADLPGNYLAWFAREGFPKGELGELLELMHTLDHNGLRGLLAPIQRAHGLHEKSKLL
jgi:uncharacterized protein (DUF3820 family)